MLKKIIITTGLAIVVPLSGLALAQGYGMNKNQGNQQPGYGMNMRQNILNLTADQQTKIQKLMTTHFQKVQKLRLDIQTKQLEMKKLMLEIEPNQSAIENKVREMTKIREQIKLERVRHQFQVRSLLTTEQRAKFPLYMKNFNRGMGKYGKKGRGNRGQGMGMNGNCPYGMNPGVGNNKNVNMKP